jgi:hypothetical protein
MNRGETAQLGATEVSLEMKALVISFMVGGIGPASWSMAACIEVATCNFGHESSESPMNPAQRYVLASSRVLVALILLLNVLGIIGQAQAAREAIKHGASVSLAPPGIRAGVGISGVHRGWRMRRP